MDVTEQALAAAAKLIGDDPVGAFLVYVLPAVIVFGNLQAAKASRAKSGAARLSPLAPRLLHCVLTAPVSFFFAYRVERWPVDVATDAAIASGLAAPFVFYLVLRVLKRRDPQAARDLTGGDDLPTELGGTSAKGDDHADK